MELIKKSFSAGLLISLGGTVYLAIENKIVAAFLFSIALFSICYFKCYLFTGKVGYISGIKNIPNYMAIWLGNFIGCSVGAIAIRIAKPDIVDKANRLMQIKINQSYAQALILGFLCGVLMYIAVEQFCVRESGFEKVFSIFICIPVFILSGFEHCIADIFYSAVAIKHINEIFIYLIYIMIITLGNTIGAISARKLLGKGGDKNAG